MRYEAVSSVVISNLIMKSVSLEFNVSSKILLKEPLFMSDPRVTELILSPSNQAAINTTRSLAECECLQQFI